MPKTRLPKELIDRFKTLDTEMQLPIVTDETIQYYCVLDKPTMYARLSKPCKCICLCGQLHNSIAEAKAHIIGKGCQYLLHWVEKSKGRAWFESIKQRKSLAEGEIAQYVLEQVCSSIGEESFLPRLCQMERPMCKEDHRQQHALHLQSKRADKLNRQKLGKHCTNHVMSQSWRQGYAMDLMSSIWWLEIKETLLQDLDVLLKVRTAEKIQAAEDATELAAQVCPKE